MHFQNFLIFVIQSLLHSCEISNQVAEPARVGRQYVAPESFGLVKHAKCSAGGNPLKLNRQDAITGLEAMAIESSQ